jgi:hypothetical protein
MPVSGLRPMIKGGAMVEHGEVVVWRAIVWKEGLSDRFY